MKKSIKLGVLIVIILTLLFVVRLMIAVDSSDTSEISIKIKSGASMIEVASDLKNENLIRSETLFKLFTRWRNVDRDVRAGRFIFSRDMSLKEIVDTLVSPQQGELSVTFPEGYTILQMDSRLVDLGLISEGEFADCTRQCDISRPTYISSGSLEGFLFPDTYYVSVNYFSSQNLIERMLQNFDSRIEDFKKDISENPASMYEVITMASIVEKEVRTAPDYSIVAGILWKRFDADWGLQADATLLYEKELRGDLDREISAADLDGDSSYNTRKFRGLPPTPISNPGLRSIEAALLPTQSPYWFYLTKPENGEVVYANTNEQHNENKSKWLY